MSLSKHTTHVTLHCLMGCLVGEVSGLMIAVLMGFKPFATIALATTLAYISGFLFALIPLMRREKFSFFTALSVIWLGEALSIGAMEVAMNGMDYMIGGIQAASFTSTRYWIGMATAVPSGFVVAWPVNYVLLKRALKKCH